MAVIAYFNTLISQYLTTSLSDHERSYLSLYVIQTWDNKKVTKQAEIVYFTKNEEKYILYQVVSSNVTSCMLCSFTLSSN